MSAMPASTTVNGLCAAAAHGASSSMSITSGNRRMFASPLQRIAHAVPCIAHVRGETLRQARTVARFERRDHLLVVADGGRPFLRTFVADVADAPQAGLQRAMHIGERLVAGRLQD